MLTLRGLEVEGFGPFADRAVLKFPDQRGVTVVYGDNMRGKTSLMNAIRYALFGEIQARGERTRGILSACNRDLVAEGKCGFTVRLSLRHEGADIDLIREVAPKVAVPRSDADFTTAVFIRRGGTVLGPANRTALLRAMLPKDVARFFLFDGELLDQYAELLISESDAGRVISEAIEQILGVPVLRDARNHLSALASDASRDSAKEASRHQQTEAIGNALQIANDVKEAHEQERDRKAAELQNLLAEREEIETNLRHQEAYAAAVERLDTARKDLETALNAQVVKTAELKVAMRDAWRTVLDEPVTAAKVAAHEAVKDVFASLISSLRVDAIENRHCGICDQDVSEEFRARLTVSLPADATAARVEDYAGIAALARRSDLDNFKQRDVRAEVRLISEAIRKARVDQADARSRDRSNNPMFCLHISLRREDPPRGIERSGARQHPGVSSAPARADIRAG